MFFDTQQSILKKLANGECKTSSKEELDWLVRVLRRFMGSLNQAVDGQAVKFNPTTKELTNPLTGKLYAKPAEYYKDFAAGKVGGHWWPRAFEEITKSAKEDRLVKNEMGAAIMAFTHIWFDLRAALLLEGPGTDAAWKSLGDVVNSAMGENTGFWKGAAKAISLVDVPDPLVWRNDMRTQVLGTLTALNGVAKEKGRMMPYDTANPFQGLSGTPLGDVVVDIMNLFPPPLNKK